MPRKKKPINHSDLPDYELRASLLKMMTEEKK